MVLAEAGAMIMACAHNPSSMWLFQVPESSLTKSIDTGCFERVERVSGVMNFTQAKAISDRSGRGLITVGRNVSCV